MNIVRQRIRNNFRQSLMSKDTRKATRRSQPYKQRPFWTRLGRTSACWDNFVNDVVVAEEWRENLRMSRKKLLKLSELLRPHIEGKTTRMRCPVDVTHLSRNGLLLCVQFVFTTLNNSLLFLVPVREVSRELRVINYNLRKIVGMTKLPFRGEGFGSCALKVYVNRSTHGRKKQPNYMKLSENL